MNFMITRITSIIFLLVIIFLSGCSGKGSSKEQASNAQSGNANPEAQIGLEIGNRAPELAYASPQGKIIALSEFRGKLVLIDFWASWCLPCRIENPNLVHVYRNYQDKTFVDGDGFTIYSVSLDSKKDAWTGAIEQDGLVWEAHVSDLKGFEAVPAAMYQVRSIPSNFLIDGNGIIIAKNLRAEELERTIKSLVK